MINMKIIFIFITMTLINHIFNMHSSRFLKNKCTFSPTFLTIQTCTRNESRRINEYSPFST